MNFFTIFLACALLSVQFLKLECKGIIKVPKGKHGGLNNPNFKQSFFNPNDQNDGSFYDFGLDYLKSDESILRAFLMTNYSADVRPVVNVSTVTYVNITLTIIQIMDLDEQNQVMITNAQIALKWHDQHLIWDPADFNNQSRIVLSSKDIWTPDIVLFNSADVAYSTQRDNYLIDVRSDGTVMWMFPDILRSYCRVDIKYFPFDRQNCSLELQSWSRSKHEVIVNYDSETPFMNHSYIHTEWKLLNITVSPLEQNDFVWLEFIVHLKRNHAFYEKITLTITILLALTVFLQLITEYTPKASKSLPIIGLYFNVNLILVLISVVLTIVVLNFHFRGPKKQRVPKWMRKYIIGYLGRIFCFGYESKQFIVREKQEQELLESEKRREAAEKMLSSSSHANENLFKSRFSLFKRSFQREKKEKSPIDDDSLSQPNEEYQYDNPHTEPAYLKTNNRLNLTKITAENNEYNLKENRIVLEYSNNTSSFNSVIHKTNKLSKTSNANEARSSTHSLPESTKSKKTENEMATGSGEQQPFSDEISRNLEKILIKMQKSFDPFKLQDENLKLAILKEILECQRLLLSSSLAKKEDKHLNITEIYDEWKILAMIVDRICFFLYLAALFVSTGLFFLREQVYNDL